MALKEDKEAVHVLMVALAAQGHINPLLRLGKRLVSKGLHVTLACTEKAQHRMIKSLTSYVSSSSSSSNTFNSISDIQLMFFADGIDLDSKVSLDHYMDTLGKVGPVNLSKLIKDYYRYNHKKFSCIINNPFVPWVADVAAEFEIPCAMLWIQACSLYAIYYRFSNNLNPFPTLENPDLSVELPGLPILHKEDLPSFLLPSNSFGTFTRLIYDLFQNLKKQYKWVLANSFVGLEKEAIDSMSELCPVQPIGPLVPPSLLGQDDKPDIGVEMWKPEDSCLEWLNQRAASSVIYVSFGSLVVLSAKQMEAIATALRNLNHPFIWVVKKPESPTDDAGKLPLGFLEETKNLGLTVSWCPQTKVLAHPAIACFVTHCGWNSMLETIAAGLPVIAFPQWTDQPTNAKLVTDVFKIGLKLRPNDDGIVSKEELEKCIKEIIRGPKSEDYRKNSMALKHAAREAVADGGLSDLNIQLFVDEILENSWESGGTLRGNLAP